MSIESTTTTSQPYSKALQDCLQKYKDFQPADEAEIVFVVGSSGSGKTMSADKMPRDKTLFVNSENKDQPYKLPFPFVMGVPYDTNRRLDLSQHISDLDKCVSMPELPYIFYDSFSASSELILQKDIGAFKGYDIYKQYAEDIWALIRAFRRLKGKIIIVTARDQIVQIEQPDGKTLSRIRVAVEGQVWEKKSIESQLTTVLFTNVKMNEKGTPEFKLSTITDGVNTAKCPPRYELPQVLPSNDIMLVINRIEKAREVKRSMQLAGVSNTSGGVVK